MEATPLVFKTYRSETGVVINVELDRCDGCGDCANSCPTNVFFIREGKCTAPDINSCIGCGVCKDVCKNRALQ